ncbi:hypothetical protein A2U01_0000743, partial [Trifolium medium]|nr:hypothetical protein [Trifolium medium]
MLIWPQPKDIKGLRGFLGLSGYYTKFVKNYGKLAWSLTQLLKKDNFSWGSEAEQAFQQLKQAMTTVPVLAVPNFDKEFIVETDASGRGIGAVLMQEGRPIAYMSQTLSDRAQKKSVYERELIAIVIAIQKLWGKSNKSGLVNCWGMIFEIKYKPGQENSAADTLSRQMQYATITTVQCEAWEGDKLKKGRLYYEDRIVIPKDSPRVPWILHEMHDTAMGGHSGYFRTYKRIASLVFWEGRLPKVGGVDTIMVVVDRLTKYAHFIPVNHSYTAKSIAELFTKEVVKLHGFPSSIVSDRDKVFLSSFWSELFKLAGTKLKYSSAYHPQTDGQTEVVNRCVETYLRCITGLKPKQWLKSLGCAEYWYNTNYHASLKRTPFEALYGRPPPVLIKGDVTHSAVEEVNRLMAERNDVLREMQEQLVRAQDVMRAQANKHRRDVEYEVGDMVYLKIKPYKMKSLAKRINQKLSPRYYGPYEILQRVGQVAYKLKLPEESKVHPVFHASLLKKYISPTVGFQPLPTCLNEEWQLEPTPEEALDTRRNDQGVVEVLVKWKGLPDFENSWESADKDFENSWESADKMRLEFPGFLLEVKESFEGGGIDSYGRVYRRT